MPEAHDKLSRIGNYVVVCEIGRGGMGTIFKAREPGTNRLVALKVLASDLAEDPIFVRRFEHEAESASKFTHPNLIQVYRAGEENGLYFIAMEFVEGESLGVHLNREGSLSRQTALTIIIRVARALDYAWKKARLVHRDIKPDNILISRDGRVKLADLGLAKSDEAPKHMTSTGTVVGSPHYISPEQARGVRDLDFRSDIYGLGCTLFHMLAGWPPYQGDDYLALLRKHLEASVPDILLARPNCPRRVAALLAQMLAKSPADRPASYDKLIAELVAAREELRTT